VVHSRRCENGIIIFLHPWWFLGKWREIISASHTIFLISYIKPILPVLWVWCTHKILPLDYIGQMLKHSVWILRYTWCRQVTFGLLKSLTFWRGQGIRLLSRHSQAPLLLLLLVVIKSMHIVMLFCCLGTNNPKPGTTSYEPLRFSR